MNDVKKDKLLNPRQVAEQLGVTPRTVVRWINEGTIEGVKVGRVWRVRESVVRNLVLNGVGMKC